MYIYVYIYMRVCLSVFDIYVRVFDQNSDYFDIHCSEMSLFGTPDHALSLDSDSDSDSDMIYST